jgi:hypothetical protein
VKDEFDVGIVRIAPALEFCQLAGQAISRIFMKARMIAILT